MTKAEIYMAILEKVSSLEEAVREHQTAVCEARQPNPSRGTKDRMYDFSDCVSKEREALILLLVDAYMLEEE